MIATRIPEPVGYAEMRQRQQQRWKQVAEEGAESTLFLLEHRPVITLGRNASEAHLLHSRDALAAMGIEVAESDRGGDVTCHGPGQLVAYPIIRLDRWKPSVSQYLRGLEEVLIRVLADYGLQGGRLAGYTGVWVQGAKVAAIGVGVRKWTTYHGIALNVRPDMRLFQCIVPCGIADKPVTSLHLLLERPPAMQDVMTRFEGHFRDIFAGV